MIYLDAVIVEFKNPGASVEGARDFAWKRAKELIDREVTDRGWDPKATGIYSREFLTESAETGRPEQFILRFGLVGVPVESDPVDIFMRGNYGI